MSDIVLVHGTTQTAAGYRRLADELTARGHRALTVDVPAGLGTADRYAEALAEQLPHDVRAPTVLAHSGAGVLLPALADRLDAAHQVWVAAAVADHAGRRSFRHELRTDPSRVFLPEWIGVDPTTDPVLAAYFLFHDADLATLREALATVARCDLLAVFDEVPTHDPSARPSTYVLPTGDRSLRGDWMARAARERLGVEPVLLDGGHNLFVARAAAVADVVEAAAR